MGLNSDISTLIPVEAWQSAMAAFYGALHHGPEAAWRAACAAMLEAWPGAKWHEVQVPDDSDEIRYMLKKNAHTLPLPTEPAP